MINGKAGVDVLTGGAGNDIFVFGANDDNDTITDFQIGQDLIRLDGLFAGDTDPNFALFLNDLQAASNNIIISSYLPGVTITVNGISNVNQLHAGDFAVHS